MKFTERIRTEVTVYTVNLRQTHFSTTELVASLFNRHFITMLAMFVALMMIADPLMVRDRIPLESILLIWTTIAVLYVALLSGMLTIVAILTSYLGRVPVYLPVLGVFNVLICSTFGNVVVSLATEGVWHLAPRPVGETLTYYIVAQIFETLYFLFVYPLLRIDFKDGEARDDPDKRLTMVEALAGQRSAVSQDNGQSPTATELRLAETQIPISTVAWVRADEHFVHIHTGDDTLFLRARLKDVVAQFPEGLGFMLHRSYWVSRPAIKRVSAKQGRTIVESRDGQVFTVAHKRKGDFMKWYSSGA